jgi:hypothetical protein
MKLSKTTSDIVRNVILGIILLVLGVFLTQTIGLFKGGFTNLDDFKTFVFYVIIPPSALIIILSLVVITNILFRDNETYGTSLCFNSPSSSPALLGTEFKFFQKAMGLFLLSLLIFSIMGLYVAWNKQSFLALGNVKESFTKTDRIAFQSFLVPISENLGIAALLTVLIFTLRFYAKKYNWSSTNFTILIYLFSIILFLTYGILNHFSVSGSTEVAITSHAGFWLIGGTITLLTGSFIPFFVMHFMNNLFYDLSTLFSNEIAISIGIVLIIIEVILLFIYISLNKNKQEEQITI